MLAADESNANTLYTCTNTSFMYLLHVRNFCHCQISIGFGSRATHITSVRVKKMRLSNMELLLINLVLTSRGERKSSNYD